MDGTDIVVFNNFFFHSSLSSFFLPRSSPFSSLSSSPFFIQPNGFRVPSAMLSPRNS